MLGRASGEIEELYEFLHGEQPVSARLSTGYLGGVMDK